MSEPTEKLFPIGTSKTRRGRENQEPIRGADKRPHLDSDEGVPKVMLRGACSSGVHRGCELQLPYGDSDNGSTPRQSSAVDGTGGIFVIETTVETLHLACNMCAVPKRKRAARKGLKPATLPERRTYPVISRRSRKS